MPTSRRHSQGRGSADPSRSEWSLRVGPQDPPERLSEFYENQQLVLEGKVNAKALVTHMFRLSEIRTAYDRFAAGDILKVMVNP